MSLTCSTVEREKHNYKCKYMYYCFIYLLNRSLYCFHFNMFIRHRHWNREINILERNYFVGLEPPPPLLLLRCFRHLCYFVNDARTFDCDRSWPHDACNTLADGYIHDKRRMIILI